MIAVKPMNILALVDEESKFPKVGSAKMVTSEQHIRILEPAITLTIVLLRRTIYQLFPMQDINDHDSFARGYRYLQFTSKVKLIVINFNLSLFILLNNNYYHIDNSWRPL